MPWLLLAPLLLWLATFVIAPTVIMGLYSLGKPGPLGTVVYDFTFDNYTRIFDAGDADRPYPYLKIFLRSFGYALGSTLICILFGYPVAYFIGRATSPRVRNLLLLAVMIPFWTNFLIRTFAWIAILNRNGLLNATIDWVNGWLTPFGAAPDGPIGKVDLLYTPTAVMIGLVYTYLPFMILPIYGSVEKLDGSLIDAALDLGASPWRAFWTVIVPLTRPGIIAGFLLVFIPAVGQFAINDILGGKIDPIVGNVIEKQFGAALNKPFGAALGMMLLAMFVACFALHRSQEQQH